MVYFVDEINGNVPKFLNLSTSRHRIGIVDLQSVHAFSMVVDSSSLYLSNDNLK